MRKMKNRGIAEPQTANPNARPGWKMYAAKGSMPEEVFHNLVASDVSKGKSKRGYLTRDGELHAIERVVVGCK